MIFVKQARRVHLEAVHSRNVSLRWFLWYHVLKQNRDKKQIRSIERMKIIAPQTSMSSHLHYSPDASLGINVER